jgi:hypothetical protein
MNPFLLWIPGFALIVVGAVLLATGSVGMAGSVALIIIGATIESTGVVLWVQQRKAQGPRAR